VTATTIGQEEREGERRRVSKIVPFGAAASGGREKERTSSQSPPSTSS
jgi:hypothetical protein